MFLAIWMVVHFGGLVACCYFDPKNLSGRRPRNTKENAHV